MKWIVTLIVSLIMISGGALAQEIPFEEEEPEMEQTVLLTAQDMDRMIASSVSNNFDLPLVETEQDQLTEDALQQILELQPSEVIVIGGPEAISDEVITQVEEQEIEEVNRIFGETAMETSIEVSMEFWDQAEEAAVVHGEPGEEAVEAIVNDQVEGPILISMDLPMEEMPEEDEAPEEPELPEDEMNGEEPPLEENEEEPFETQELPEEEQEMNGQISQEVVDEIERLGVQNVVLYTPDEQAAQQLEELGLEVEVIQIEGIEPEDPEEEENGLIDEFEDFFNGEDEEDEEEEEQLPEQ